ncbi:hypothetical protein CTI12_AA235210 [Artemisia annua]|uniref:CCHC-type domain-containing protein n=1 Tax=Artemisia annua TaxID=35608 RepID=A0A2U1NRK3_ARTAN|nr:hypothetical protein CTI12_AA235210 [Artemisia annua]
MTNTETTPPSQETRYVVQDAPRSFSTRQNGRTLASYYNELIGIFQEIDTRLMFHEDSVEHVVSLNKILGRLRVHIFLAGLDPDFNQARGEILRKDPPLDLEACYAFVRKDQTQRSTMEEPKNEPDSIVNLATRNRFSKGKNTSNKLVCTHCGEEGHSKQRCYEIVGYPEWWDFSKKPRRKVGQASTATAKNDDTNPVAAHTESFNDYGNSEIPAFGGGDNRTSFNTETLAPPRLPPWTSASIWPQ